MRGLSERSTRPRIPRLMLLHAVKYASLATEPIEQSSYRDTECMNLRLPEQSQPQGLGMGRK